MSVNSFNAQNPPVTTKGDVFTFSTIPTRLGVGTNNQVLTADSTTATGLKWATPASGAVSFLAFGGLTSWARGATAATSGFTSANNAYGFVYFVPISLPACTLDRIQFKTGTTFSGATTMRLGIYQNSSNNLPETLLLDAGTVSATATNTNYSITINQTVTAGWYWLAIAKQTNNTNHIRFYLGQTGNARFGQSISTNDVESADILGCVLTTSGATTGALGNFTTASLQASAETSNNLPALTVRLV